MYNSQYNDDAPSPEDVRQWRGIAVLEFGTAWCPICRAAQPDIEEVLSEASSLPHVKVEDGPGRKLGRFFRVKLWPTLIFLRDGQEAARVVRPADAQAIRNALAQSQSGAMGINPPAQRSED
jgi:thioredoxin 1